MNEKSPSSDSSSSGVAAPGSASQDELPRFRIWALPCAFKKDGTPSLGSFGKTVRNVVILPVETWTQLCRENPALAATKFDVGTF